MELLIVEDDDFKCEAIQRKLKEFKGIGSVNIDVATSVRDGVVRLAKRNIDIVILDMALPTFKPQTGLFGASGSAQPGGGVDILRTLQSMNLRLKVIVLTQYPDIEVNGVVYLLDESRTVLRETYDCDVIACLRYVHDKSEWVSGLRSCLEPLL